MAVYPLRPATHHRLGGPLPHQLANAPQVHPCSRLDGRFNILSMRSVYLSGFSYRFQQLSRTHGQVTYVLLTRSPLSLFGSKLPEDFVRLACIRHAASVHPEPGSNSPFDLALTHDLRLNFIFVIVIPRILFSQIIDVSCSVFKDRNFYFVCRCTHQRSYIIQRIIPCVNDKIHFFHLFFNIINRKRLHPLFTAVSLFYRSFSISVYKIKCDER